MKILISSLLRLGTILCTAAVAGGLQAAPLKVLINPGDQGEQSRFSTYSSWKSIVTAALEKDKKGSGTGAEFVMSTNATDDLPATRSHKYDIIVAPSHVIGSAVRFGYTPVVGVANASQAVLVTMQSNAMGNLAQSAGKQLGVPMQDSVVTYLLRGEVNAANTTIKRHFKSQYSTRYQDALLTCLQTTVCDVVAVERATYERWLANKQPVKIIMQSKDAPGISMVVKDDIAIDPKQLQARMLAQSADFADRSKLVAVEAPSFTYISTLGYHTPRSLDGTSLVDAAAVVKLLERKVLYIDARTEAEFKDGHAPGAVLLPYVEKSLKDADFDASLDSFDLSKLPSNKNAEIIFGCGGGECWKSYKASRAALKAGYTKIYWFRGGFVEWRATGQKIATGN